ncbi:DUF5682 family protein [Vibrio sp. Of7-15]|uniref:DUF5682 family protein n=1 Tax=Vibrio sp. Of7-15 TaxID=2724879 RepID=UPI001EF16A03|nr:DUF5682 family protein [Vibrio sp. Of7-15]MCG7497477.1 DUF5682 family protein [Vibrio sp. Of7-15]
MNTHFSVEINQALSDIQSAPNIVWAPIRHHSPQCSRQLQQLIQQHQPDIILVEGPSEAQHLLPFMLDNEAKPPLAIYNYVIDNDDQEKTNTESNNDVTSLSAAEHYRCYVPFSEMSPEWVAIQAAKEHGIECEFIDLPYVNRLYLSDNNQDYCGDNEAQIYHDKFLSQNHYIDSLLEQSQSPDFDTWWERHFESNVSKNTKSADEFFQRLLTLCLLIRNSQETIQGLDNETLAREQFMAHKLRQHIEAGKRCLVVCGGFHCLGIFQFLSSLQDKKIPPAKSAPHTKKKASIKTGTHLIAYSLERMNKAADYSAGMPDTGYYHAVWQDLQGASNANINAANREQTPQQQALHSRLCAALVDRLREANQLVSLPDAIEANVMMERLAQLRGHAAGRKEFREAITACFLKQAQDGSEKYFTQLVDHFLAGDQFGQLPGGLPLSPLIQDFHAQCHQFDLPLIAQKTLPYRQNKESIKTLQIYRKHKHRQISQLLHQLAFLNSGYAHKRKGPDFIQGTDLNLVREIWQVEWQPEVEAHILECSHYGNTLREAALNKLLLTFNIQNSTNHRCVIALLHALCMGLHQIIKPIADEIAIWLQQESDPCELANAFYYLSMCFQHKHSLTTGNIALLHQLLSTGYQRFCVRMPWLAISDQKQSDTLVDQMNMMANTINSQPTWHCDPVLFYDALHELVNVNPHPTIKGVSLGILCRDQQIPTHKVHQHVADAFTQAVLTVEYCGDFLRGFFLAARAIFLESPELIETVNKHVLTLDEQAFLAALPSLRLAFTSLSPREVFQFSQVLSHKIDTNKASPITVGESCPQSSLDNAYTLRQQFAPLYALWGGKQ